MRRWLTDIALEQDDDCSTASEQSQIRSEDNEDAVHNVTSPSDVARQPLSGPGVNQKQFNYDQMNDLAESCQQASRENSFLGIDNLNEEAYSALVQQYLGLLRRLKEYEDKENSEGKLYEPGWYI